MTYSLWDCGSGNLIDSFDSEDEALRAAAEEVRINNDAEDLALEAHDSAGNTFPIAAGAALAELATRVVQSGGAVTA